jgi:hypothetical protein
MPSDTGNILWLHGVFGAGKSTISMTVSQYFRDICRLGAFIVFDRDNPAGTSASAIICTIAYRLAAFNPQIRTAVYEAIAKDPTLPTAPIHTQFQRLLEPLTAARDHILGPVIVILDALDECGLDRRARRSLVSLIADEFTKLPAVFRFLITSRTDSDITSRFETQPHITKMVLDITTEATKNDIVAYVRQSMDDIRKNRNLDPMWPGQSIIQRLADSAAGLFIWASTASMFIDDFHPEKRLDIVLELGQKGTKDLSDLYATALQHSGRWDDETFCQEAIAVLSAAVLSRVPLTDAVIDLLLDLGSGRSCEVLTYLGCFVHWSPGQSVHLLHASFGDYLTNRSLSGNRPWFVDSRLQSRHLALACLRVLNAELRFNICGLEDSHLLNAEVQSLPARVEAHISPQLSYASQFWSTHLHDADFDAEILDEITNFTDQKFLYWLEILSLLQRVPISIESLEIAVQYAPVSHGNFTIFPCRSDILLVTWESSPRCT